MGNAYRYVFIGKKNDNEVKGEGNQQDCGMRIYDPRVGCFLYVDPIADNITHLIPYQFASDDPIQNIDGLEGGSKILSKKLGGLARSWNNFKVM